VLPAAEPHGISLMYMAGARPPHCCSRPSVNYSCTAEHQRVRRLSFTATLNSKPPASASVALARIHIHKPRVPRSRPLPLHPLCYSTCPQAAAIPPTQLPNHSWSNSQVFAKAKETSVGIVCSTHDLVLIATTTQCQSVSTIQADQST
jgi:hypothetical protein